MSKSPPKRPPHAVAVGAVLVAALSLELARVGLVLYAALLGSAPLAIGLLRGRRFGVGAPTQGLLAAGGMKAVLDLGPKFSAVIDDDAGLAVVGLGMIVALIVLARELAAHFSPPKAKGSGRRVQGGRAAPNAHGAEGKTKGEEDRDATRAPEGRT
jgi:hypothetical protein